MKRSSIKLTKLSNSVSSPSSVIFAFVTGFVAIFRKREHSLSVYISAMVGALLIIFPVGEISFPH